MLFAAHNHYLCISTQACTARLINFDDGVCLTFNLPDVLAVPPNHHPSPVTRDEENQAFEWLVSLSRGGSLQLAYSETEDVHYWLWLHTRSFLDLL